MRVAKTLFLLLLVTLGMASCGAMAQTLEKSRITLAVGGKNLFYCLPLTIAGRRGAANGAKMFARTRSNPR